MRLIRPLLADKQLSELSALMRDVRAAEMPALRSALAVLETIDFSGKAAAVSGLSQAISKLAALQQESAAALMQPKASRRLGRDVRMEELPEHLRRNPRSGVAHRDMNVLG